MNIFYTFINPKHYLIGYGTPMTCERSAADVNGEWTNITDLLSPGAYYAAMVTLNGKAYLMGGYSTNARTTVQMHDGGTPGTWTNKAPILSERWGHSVLALDNNRALLCGGKSAEAVVVNTCHIYTASTDSWASTASMAYNRNYFGLVMSESMSVTTRNTYIYCR